MQQSMLNVLVTGGSRRIGRAIVEDLAAHGWGVAIHCNASRGEADALRDAVAGAGGRAVVVTADLTDRDAVAALLDDAGRTLGPLSVVVNNASAFDDDSADTFAWDTWDRHFALHLETPVALTRALAGHLAPGAHGLVVNMIDQRVWKPTPRSFSYSLSKAALWDATRTLAQAFAPRLRVNAIGPGPTLPSPRQQPADFQAQLDSLLLRRGPTLPDFGATIRYLWEARSVTGQMIALDGGQHLAWQTPDVAGIAE